VALVHIPKYPSCKSSLSLLRFCFEMYLVAGRYDAAKAMSSSPALLRIDFFHLASARRLITFLLDELPAAAARRGRLQRPAGLPDRLLHGLGWRL